MDRLKPARRGARAPQACVRRLLPRESARAAPPFHRERTVARSRLRTWERRLLVDGRGWHMEARSCPEGDRPSRWRSELPWRIGRLQPARHGARALQTRVLRLLPRERAVALSRGAHAHSRTPVACWRPRLARWSTFLPREREDVLLALWASIEHGQAPTSEPRRTRAASARKAPSIHRERSLARSRVRKRKRRLLVGGCGWHAGARL